MSTLAAANQALIAGNPKEAARICDQLLPRLAGKDLGIASLLRGVAAVRLNEPHAERHLRTAFQQQIPGSGLQLGRFYLAKSRYSEAIAVLKDDPDPIARLLAGECLFLSGKIGDAARKLTSELQNLSLKPSLVPFYNRLAQIEATLGHWQLSAQHAERVLTLEPDNLVARMGLARSYTRLNRCLDTQRILSKSPTLPYRWLDARAIPVVYRDEAEIQHYRARYTEKLTALAQEPFDQRQALSLVDGIEGAFYTHYACEDDRPLQKIHGTLVHRVIHTAYPKLQDFQPPPSREKLRVGFASAWFHEHTISRLFRGWIQELDRSQFEVGVYPLGVPDAWCQKILEGADRTRSLTGADVEHDARTLRDEQLDVLIYPELGMDIRMLKLASVRNAPVQAVAWGHPVTTGLPTMDWFLSSAAMEPQAAEAHYTEKLHCLPGLSLCIDPPPGGQSRRSDLGIPEDRFLLFCTQSIFKLLPRNDHIFAWIARAVPRALLVFVGVENAVGSDVFQARLERAFSKEGLDYRQHVILFPSVSHAGFLAINRVADLFLDGLAWSGGMTTLEAVASGLLPVATEGPWMRMRHSAAILRMLGLGELVALEPAGVVELIRKLAEDREYLGYCRGILRAQSPALWLDRSPVRALENWVRSVAGSKV